MKFTITNIGSINSIEIAGGLRVHLKGDDGSECSFVIDVSGKNIKNLTLGEIEQLAIQHMRKNMSNCSAS
ncbi:hypothetical protein [Providencia rettgeri]